MITGDACCVAGVELAVWVPGICHLCCEEPLKEGRVCG